mmetsp:Transcript_71755/g.159566  ORF Transcript_71755/g.159566 Transcript_71755/m.159566 type:complete len:151 (-) Transcript_71755:98-550(-)
MCPLSFEWGCFSFEEVRCFLEGTPPLNFAWGCVLSEYFSSACDPSRGATGRADERTTCLAGEITPHLAARSNTDCRCSSLTFAIFGCMANEPSCLACSAARLPVIELSAAIKPSNRSLSTCPPRPHAPVEKGLTGVVDDAFCMNLANPYS